MDTITLKEKFSRAYRQYARVLAFAIVCFAVIAVIVVGEYIFQDRIETNSEMHEATNTVSPFIRSKPTEIRIPRISLNTTFEAPLGLNSDKTISVPDSYTQVGWYKEGSTPGENGPAVILGHVDSVDGPAVFFSLGQLQKGDTIEVEREDGTTAVFEVEELQRYPQTDFPTERVYGKTDAPTLRLVTCTGTFNKGEQRYSHNLVVYASLKSN